MPKAPTPPKRRPGRPRTESPAEPRARAYFYLSQAEFAKLKQLAEGCKGGVAE